MVLLEIGFLSHGLRQGDPMHPFLFTLVVDIRSKVLDMGVQAGLVEGFNVGRKQVQVSHSLWMTPFLPC